MLSLRPSRWLVARNRPPVHSPSKKSAVPVASWQHGLRFCFFADAARRVAGTCPAGPPDLYRRETPAVALVREQTGHGRFYDDGADDAATVARRTREAGGLDLCVPRRAWRSASGTRGRTTWTA